MAHERGTDSVSKDKPKLTVTVGEDRPHWRHGTTAIDGEFQVTVTWRLGVTNVVKDFDEDGFEDTSYSDRFVANPPKKTLGNHYERIRKAAIMASELQRRAESEARNGEDRVTERKTAELNAQDNGEGWTIIFNQAAIEAEAKKLAEAQARCNKAEDDGLTTEDILGGAQSQ